MTIGTIVHLEYEIHALHNGYNHDDVIIDVITLRWPLLRCMVKSTSVSPCDKMFNNNYNMENNGH